LVLEQHLYPNPSFQLLSDLMQHRRHKEEQQSPLDPSQEIQTKANLPSQLEDRLVKSHRASHPSQLEDKPVGGTKDNLLSLLEMRQETLLNRKILLRLEELPAQTNKLDASQSGHLPVLQDKARMLLRLDVSLEQTDNKFRQWLLEVWLVSLINRATRLHWDVWLDDSIKAQMRLRSVFMRV
jgi:hypothetical protein